MRQVLKRVASPLQDRNKTTRKGSFMKNWIISHKILAIALVCVLGVGVICAVVLPIALAHKHEFSAEWTTNETNHWHSATCEHTDEKKDFGAHVWDGGVITRPADFGVVGERKFTCKDCGYSYTEDIDALGAKDNEIRLAEGKTLDRTYDGKDVDVSDQFAFNGNGEVTVTFKEKDADDNTYAAPAPRNAGEYTVKVSVRATAEWKAASKTFDFAIAKKELTGVATKEYDGDATMPATLTGVLDGETVTATITMTSANVGAAVQSFELTGKDAGNYSLARADAEIVKADIEFEISNASAFTEFFVGATNIPDPTTGYVEIGDGYGAKTIVWEKQLEGGAWSRTLTKEEVRNEKTGFRRHCLQHSTNPFSVVCFFVSTFRSSWSNEHYSSHLLTTHTS